MADNADRMTYADTPEISWFGSRAWEGHESLSWGPGYVRLSTGPVRETEKLSWQGVGLPRRRPHPAPTSERLRDSLSGRRADARGASIRVYTLQGIHSQRVQGRAQLPPAAGAGRGKLDRRRGRARPE